MQVLFLDGDISCFYFERLYGYCYELVCYDCGHELYYLIEQEVDMFTCVCESRKDFDDKIELLAKVLVFLDNVYCPHDNKRKIRTLAQHLFAQRKVRAWKHLKRHVRIVGTACLQLSSIYNEVRFRPLHTGYFEALNEFNHTFTQSNGEKKVSENTRTIHLSALCLPTGR